MGIFEAETLARKKRTEIATMADGMLFALINSVRASYNAVWKTEGVTPQEILDEFGTDAAKLFIASTESQKLIKKLKPDYEFLRAPNEITINDDGTVTVGEPVQEG